MHNSDSYYYDLFYHINLDQYLCNVYMYKLIQFATRVSRKNIKMLVFRFQSKSIARNIKGPNCEKMVY